jgi:copper chaperone CopZ
MQRVFLFSTLCVLLAYGIGCTTTGQDVLSDTAAKSEKRVYEVFGMDCPGCHGGVEKLVKKIAAVAEAEANWQKKEIVVTLRPGAVLNDEDIYDAVRRANFTPGKRIR